MSNEYLRKLFHIGTGLVLGSIIYFLRKRYSVFLITFGVCVGMFIRLLILEGYKIGIINKFLKLFGRYLEYGLGALLFFMGSLITVLVFDSKIAGIGVFVLGISDGLATIVGLNSKIKIYNKKTFGGSLTFLISTIIVLLFFEINIVNALMISLIVNLLELFSPVDDNLVIPFFTTFLISMI